MFLRYLCQQNLNTNVQFGNSTSPIVFDYSGGTTIVNDYKSSDKVNYATDFTGLNLNDTDLILNSSTGSVYLRNVRDQLINVADSAGDVVAYGYMASGAGAINGSNFSQLEVIVGADNLTNKITAGSGGSSLWGGAGSTSDTLIGGGGEDIFFYASGNGKDTIQKATSADTVNLLGMSLENISSAKITSSGVNLTFSDGGSLKVSGQAGNFNLNGQIYHANYKTKTWEI